MLPPVLIVRIPFQRPQGGGYNNFTPADWAPEKERLLWEELSAARARGGSDIDWQRLSTRLECSLPYLLYKTQVQYEEDLRRIHEVKPVISTTTLPRKPNDEDQARVPSLTGRAPHTETSSDQFTIPPRKHERLLLPPAWALSRARSSRVQLPSTGGQPGKCNSRTASLDSSGTEQDYAGRRKDEQEDLSRKLEELGRMMSSDALGFARVTNNRTLPRRALEAPLSRISHFAHGALPSTPSSGSSSPGHQIPKMPRTSGLKHYTPSQSRSQNSQSSEASSFSDISDASISASVLEETLLSRAVVDAMPSSA